MKRGKRALGARRSVLGKGKGGTAPVPEPCAEPRAQSPAPRAAFPRVSIVVLTHNRAGSLAACLQSIGELDWGPDRLELLVVGDEEIEDDTEGVVRRFAGSAPFPVRYLIAPNRLAMKRNAGWQAAAGEIIAFTDDDCRVDPMWLQAGCAALEDAALAGVQGQTVVPEGEGDGAFYHATRELTNANYQTCNILYRREALAAVGGFDARFVVIHEDSDLAFALLASGRQIGVAPGAIVYHPPRREDGWNPLRAARRALWAPLLHKKHPRQYRERLGSPLSRSTRAALALDAGTLAAFVGLGIVPALPILGARLLLLGLQIGRHCRGSRDLRRVGRTGLSCSLAPIRGLRLPDRGQSPVSGLSVVVRRSGLRAP